MTRPLTALALADGVLLAGAAPPFAHNVLVSTDPPNGASVEWAGLLVDRQG